MVDVEGTRDMTEFAPDGTDARAGSVLVTGPAPDRFERAAELLTDEVVVAGVGDGLDAALTAAGLEDPAVVPADDRDEPALSDIGVSIADRVAGRSSTDVLIAVGALADSEPTDSCPLFRFLHLTGWRVTEAGGRFVCTLGDGVDPIAVETIGELFDDRVRLGPVRDGRAANGLSP